MTTLAAHIDYDVLSIYTSTLILESHFGRHNVLLENYTLVHINYNKICLYPFTSKL